MKNICIAGCHTDAGKTHASAALCAAFGFDYFKLMQAGEPTDSAFIKAFSDKYCTGELKAIKIHPAGATLKHACSPHVAMIKENVELNGLDIKLPSAQNTLIELAGGLFTPLDKRHFMIDYALKHDLDVFLVAGEYLGSINHTALSIEALKARNINILGVIFSRCKDELSKDFLRSHYSYINFFELGLIDGDLASVQNACISLKEQILATKVLK